MYDFSPSLSLDNIFGSELTQNYENFSLFMKAYYEWLQTTKITLSDTSGTFVKNEIIVGATTGARATIKEVGSGYIVVDRTTITVFDNYETITGLTSAANGKIITIKDNVVKSSGSITDYKSIDKTIDKYADYLKNEIYPSIPKEIYGNKREVAKKFREFYRSKGNQASFEFFFKLIYDENIELYYPGEDILRISDGNFEKTQILRTFVTSNIFEFLNKTIRGTTSGAIGNVVDIKTFFLGAVQIAEFTLVLVSGTFSRNETVQAVDDITLQTTTYGMITGFTINDGGSGYSVGNQIVIDGDGNQATAIVSSIDQSPITKLKINSIGYGYRANAYAVINNTGTGGSGLVVKITELANTFTVTDGSNNYTVGEISELKVISRGSGYFKAPTITLQDTTIADIGLLSEDLIEIINGGTNYVVGDWLDITGGDGSGANGIVASVEESITYDFLFEDDRRMILETGKDILKNEDWSVSGPIIRVELTDFGSGYTNDGLPSINVVSGTGTSAILTANGILGNNANVEVDVSNNATGIGSIRAIEITNFGVNYTSATANAEAIGDGNANLTPVITGLGIKDGNWIDDDGKIDYKIIQDSFYYQDFSYVIRSGLIFNSYKDLLKKIIHPAGLQAFGEIIVTSFAQVRMRALSAIEILRDVEHMVVSIISVFTTAAVGIDTRTEIRKTITALIDAISNLSQSERLITRRTLSDATSDIIDKEYFVSIRNLENIGSSLSNKEYSLKFDIPINVGGFDQVQAGSLLWGNLPISQYANSAIDQYQNVKFETAYSTTLMTRNSRIDGTVTITGNVVIGTSTDFTSDFITGDNFIINGEKFLISSVANATYMELNVPAIGSYTDENAYKETVL